MPDLSPLFWLGGFSSTKINHREIEGTLILTSLLEDLEDIFVGKRVPLALPP